ncbi:DUF6082 family protein [Solwaraspora sp. WMMD1047]|uniref:DUF6082 family protein n=1 Tax=Solwaraspora sp. WMMD1047 TaxID=3016102 RepID=UPI0024179004|nr:DUF6082 family protein [Solwaraspora sp. WMMD1047]MDG4834030.1 DUF6082 family protein [Solwaraspora sp. WMMD1047]
MSDHFNILRTLAVRGAALLAGLVVLISAPVGLLLSPMLISTVDREDRDWARLSDIGETYGAVSAMLATLALGVVSVSLILQRSQVRHERIWLQRELHVNIVSFAIEDPVFAQCWGPRVAPPDMDERLFYYLNLIVMLWSHAWEHRLLPERQARTYAQSLFESEVAREYWNRFGAWRAPAGSRERSFIRLVQQEYERAVLAGPPTRPYEPPAGFPGPSPAMPHAEPSHATATQVRATRRPGDQSGPRRKGR